MSHAARVVVFQGSGKPAVQVCMGDDEYETWRLVARVMRAARMGIAMRSMECRVMALDKDIPCLR